jgi:chromosomal replication initiator protein
MSEEKAISNNVTLTPSDIWNKCLSIIKDNVNWRAFQTWFEPISAVDIKNNILTIQVPSQFFYEWLEEHYVELLGKTIKRVLGRDGGLAYRIQMENPARMQNPATMELPSNSHVKTRKEGNYVNMDYVMEDPMKIKNPFVIPGMKRVQIDPQLNPNLNFDNYIEGECNRLARTAGMHIAQKPGTTSFNPMMVFGGTSCGKTHLMQAIGNETKRLNPNKTVLYVSAEKFINQFIEHSKNGEVNNFIHFYQLIDVLLIDDIHLFVTAPKTQDVFFAIFNHLQQNGKQIVLTSDTPPKDLEGMQERLLSRFRWGLHAEISAPDFDTRKAILEMKMRNEGLEIPEEVVHYVAYNVQNNIRDLEGIVISLFAQATLNKKEVDLDLAKKVMKNFIKSSNTELKIEDIQNMVCEFYGLGYDTLLSKSRKREIVQARQITMYLAKKFTKNSLKSIGEHFAGKDHTTVIHSCQTVENLMDTDSEYREKLEEIMQKVQIASI